MIDARQRAILIELISLGTWQERAARLCGISSGTLFRLKKRWSLSFPPRGNRDTPFRREVRVAYAPGGEGPHGLALRTGRSEGSIKVTASRMGLTDGGDNRRFKRPFVLPKELREEYKSLRRLGLTMEECAQSLGILSR